MHPRPLSLVVVALGALAAGSLPRCTAAGEAAVSFAEACPPTEGGADAAPGVTAIGLRAAPAVAAAAAHVSVLVDTSASQTGSHRAASLAALRGLLSKARPKDAVAVAAVDVACVPLTERFQTTTDPAVEAAVEKLEARTPLGTTDLVAVLGEAALRFDGVAGTKSIVYVGDGPNLGAVDPDEFVSLLDLLRTRRISVSAIGIGDRVNWPCLAAVASATGGMLVVPDADEPPTAAGGRMASLAVQPVTWPEDVTLSSEAPDARLRMLPGRLPPLRSDRDSVVLVEGALEAGKLSVACERDGGRASIEFAIPATTPRAENAYLAELARNARESDGVFLPILGREGLALARGVVRGEAATLAALSRQAQAAGASASAVRLAEASLRRDPDNPDAALVREVAQRQLDADAADRLPEPASDFDAPPADAPGSELAELAAMRRVRAQNLEQDIAVGIREARQLLTTDPDLARDQLKQLQDRVRGDDDLDDAVRQRLLAQLEMRTREAVIRSREKVERDLAAERRAAIGRERARLNTELQRREDKVKSLTERYNALVEEGIRVGYQRPTTAFTQAEREVAEQIAEEAPRLYAAHPMPMTARAVAVTAPLVAQILNYDAENMRIRRDTQRAFMDTLHLVDVAGIPFPDEPPILYPSAARWREITELRKKYKSVDLANPGSAEQKIFAALERPVEQFQFEETPLRDVIATIRDAQNVPVQLDIKALEEAGIDLDMPVTADISGVSLRSALRLMLGNLDLTYLVKDEVLLVTTKEKAQENLVVKVYPVADLVLPINPTTGVNPFQMGGGMGGQGMMNSGMGMGMGMGGMGMGGMGMGGMGGMCWVAREVYGVHDPRWRVFRGWITTEAPAWLRDTYERHGESFAVWLHDHPTARAVVRRLMDLVVEPRLGPTLAGGAFQVSEARARLAATPRTGVVRTAASEASAPTPPETDGLPADVLGAEDLRSALAAYLPAADAGKPAADPPADDREAEARLARLRTSAADLGRRGDFARAANLIEAAITCGHVEPWMYEALAVAMEAAGRPRGDVERVLLSSADFAGSPVELVQLAHYLARFGSDRQAIRICRRVTRLDPTNREAYALAMSLGARCDDPDTLRWACPGVLAHEWPVAQQDIVTRAARLARATIDKLAADGRADDAAAFRAAVDEALVRDVVIELSWTGDADVDMLVEEPTGTVCSVAAPRSAAGGVLLADADATVDPTNATHRERYVAGAAFPGEYRVLVRRVWGKVAGDTITAEMTIHRGTDREERLRRQVRIGADDQLLAVTVPEGRRREPLLDAQVAQDVAAQRVLGRAVLAQQLAAISDPKATASLAQSRANAAGDGQPILGVPFFNRRGAVGYQPQISTLPEGANMSARAVISADRRYVRVTCQPLFSLVGQVTQFNFSGGGAGGTGSAGGIAGGTGGGAGFGGGAIGGGGFGGGQGGGLGGGGLGGGLGGGGLGGGGLGGGGLGGGGLGGAALGGGGIGQGICWVAREVYGNDDPRWLLFRDWLRSDAPAWLYDAYAAHGEAVAAWIRDKPGAKAALRVLMDRAIADRLPPAGP